MLAEMQIELARMRSVQVSSGPVQSGRVVACDGGLIEVSGLALPIGSLGVIENEQREEALAEVIGFRTGHSLMMLLRGLPLPSQPRYVGNRLGRVSLQSPQYLFL